MKNKWSSIGTIFLFIFLFESGDSSRAADINKIQNLETELQTAVSDETRAFLLNNLAFEYAQTDPDKAKKLATMALALAEKNANEREMGQSFTVIGIAFWTQGDYEQALEYQHKALQIHTKLQDKTRIAHVLNNIGAIYHQQSNYEKALQYYFKALKIYEELNQQENIAIAYNNIGVIIKAQGDYEKALGYYFKALHLYESSQDFENMAKCYHNIGIGYMNLSQNEKAHDFYRKSLSMKEKIADTNGVANSYMSLGALASKDKDYGQALEYYLTALQIMKEIGNKSGIAYSFSNIGTIYKYLGNYELAYQNLQRGLRLAQEIGAPNIQMDIFHSLADLEERRGNYKSSLNYHKTYGSLKNAVYNTEKSKLIEEIQARYGAEKKEAEISLLNKEKEMQQIELQRQQDAIRKQRYVSYCFILGFSVVACLSMLLTRQYRHKKRANLLLNTQNVEIKLQKEEIERQKNSLETLISTKDKFFTLIAHDLRNPFTSLLSITQSLSEGNLDLNEEDIRFYHNKVYSSAQRIYQLLENLLQWSLCQTGRLELEQKEIELGKLVNDCLSLVRPEAEKKEIQLNSTIPSQEPVFADENMVRTILRNLVSNAIKFNNPGGTVTIQAQVQDTFVHVSIADTGRGMSPEDLANLFRIDVKTKSIGADRKENLQEKGTGLGLILCKEFVELNGGSIWMDSTLNQGTTVSFSLRCSP